MSDRLSKKVEKHSHIERTPRGTYTEREARIMEQGSVTGIEDVGYPGKVSIWKVSSDQL